MTSIDIVARLRSLANGGRFDALPVVTEAADTIERLRGGIAELELRVAEDDARWSQITISSAQAGEAGTAETTKIGSVHEHAVPEGNAP